MVLVERNLAATLALAHRAYIINNGHIVHMRPQPMSSRQTGMCCVGILAFEFGYLR
jgi:ABC-type branched-subunit amino acid transport system ATPase component